jgi:hypothetical protein
MELKIQKKTCTYADILEAVGVADLVAELAGKDVRIEDVGPEFCVRTDGGKEPETWKAPSPGYPLIFVRKKDGAPPLGWFIDYESDQQKAKALRSAPRGDKGVSNGDNLPHPSREYRIAAVLASLRMGWESDKKLYRWIEEHPGDALLWAKERLSGVGPALPPIELSGSQFFSPASGKGVHATKTVSKSPGSLNKALIDPFSEWMKYRGAFSAMLAYRRDEDFKLFVIEPGDISINALSELRCELADLNLWGGVRLDIQATLRLAEYLILKSDVMGRQIGMRRRMPNEIVQGLHQAYFKSLGTASALMDDVFLPLPGWFVIEDRQAAEAFLGIIEEHIGVHGKSLGCLGSLRDDRSGDLPVLQQYRRWLTTGELEDFLEFSGRFCLHVIQRRSARAYVREFSIVNLNELFLRGYAMETKEIVSNEGFLSVARAIRNSTIYAVGNNISGREPRFGLAQSWKQKMKGGVKAFVPVLSGFIQQYNWETAHKLEGKGHSVREKELGDVLRLIDSNGAELVGMLLLAYGFARKSREDMPDPD